MLKKTSVMSSAKKITSLILFFSASLAAIISDTRTPWKGFFFLAFLFFPSKSEYILCKFTLLANKITFINIEVKKNYRTTGYNGLLGLITNMLKIGFKTRFIQKKVQIYKTLTSSN